MLDKYIFASNMAILHFTTDLYLSANILECTVALLNASKRILSICWRHLVDSSYWISANLSLRRCPCRSQADIAGLAWCDILVRTRLLAMAALWAELLNFQTSKNNAPVFSWACTLRLSLCQHQKLWYTASWSHTHVDVHQPRGCGKPSFTFNDPLVSPFLFFFLSYV